MLKIDLNMKKLILLILGIVVLAGCHKDEIIPTEPAPYADPKDPAIISIPVPELNYRTGGKSHLISIDSEHEASDPQLKMRTLKMIYSLYQILKEYSEDYSEYFQADNTPSLMKADITEQIVPISVETAATTLLGLLTTATLTSAGIHNYTFTYKTVNGKGEQTSATAALFVPKKGMKLEEVPVLVFPMFGVINRLMSPSFCVRLGLDYGVTDWTSDNVFGAAMSMIYELIARTGYAVLCPDGLGMGENYDNHMICTKTGSYAIADALLACRDIVFDDEDAQWDKQSVCILGTSEGGYTAMETCKVLQEEYSDIFNVLAGACVDGPYDVSGSMLKALFGTTSQSHSAYEESLLNYVVPMIYSLSDTYGAVQPFFSYKNAFRNDVKGIDNFPEYLNKYYTDPSKYLDFSYTNSFIQAIKNARIISDFCDFFFILQVQRQMLH